MWNPVAETFVHKLDPFRPVSDILLFLLGGARPLKFCFDERGNDELLLIGIDDELVDEFNDDDGLLLLDELSPEKTT